MLPACTCLVAFAIIFLQPARCAAQSKTTDGKAWSAKSGFGIRLGANFANVNGGGDSIRYSYKPGFMVAFFLSPPHRGIIGYRGELLYSKQGFKYTTPAGISGTVSNDYLMMPHLMTIDLSKFVQLQIGAFAGYLLRSKDSRGFLSDTNSGNAYKTLLDYMNRFDYGAAGGIEIHPFKGFIINGRYHMGFAKLYKTQTDTNPGTNQYPYSPLSAFSNINPKNAVIQLSIGYQF